jgi:hypothetical protein
MSSRIRSAVSDSALNQSRMTIAGRADFVAVAAEVVRQPSEHCLVVFDNQNGVLSHLPLPSLLVTVGIFKVNVLPFSGREDTVASPPCARTM